MRMKKVIQWACGTAAGNVAMFGVATVLAGSALFLTFDYLDGTVSATHAIKIIALSAILGSLGGISFWYAVTSRLTKTNEPPKR